jgi:hypothetical protein
MPFHFRCKRQHECHEEAQQRGETGERRDALMEKYDSVWNIISFQTLLLSFSTMTTTEIYRLIADAMLFATASIYLLQKRNNLSPNSIFAHAKMCVFAGIFRVCVSCLAVKYLLK